MGVDIDRIIAVTFIIGAGLGAVAGVMVGTYYGMAHYSMGAPLGMKAFLGRRAGRHRQSARRDAGRHAARRRRSAGRGLHRRSDLCQQVFFAAITRTCSLFWC